MSRVLCILYSLSVYLLFLGTFTYAALFIGGLWVPRTIDSGPGGDAAGTILVNAALLGLFALQHTLMARSAFKTWITKYIPKAVERSTFVLVASLCLLLLCRQWRAMPDIVWDAKSEAVRTVLWALFALGWLLVLYASFLIDHFELFGLRQAYLHLQGQVATHPAFVQPWLYRVVRNPLMLGFVIAFWSAPTMSQGRLLFAILGSAYILVGIRFEERDLLRILGNDYRSYRARTAMLIPFVRFGAARPPAPKGA